MGPNPHDWCLYKKRRETSIYTEEKLCEDMGKVSYIQGVQRWRQCPWPHGAYKGVGGTDKFRLVECDDDDIIG